MRFEDSAELYWSFRKKQEIVRIETEILGHTYRKKQKITRIETEILGHTYMIRYNPDEEGKKKACLAAGKLARDDRFPNFTYIEAARFSQLIMGIEWTNKIRLEMNNYLYKKKNF